MVRTFSLWAKRLPVAAFARLLPGDTVVGEGRGMRRRQERRTVTTALRGKEGAVSLSLMLFMK